MTVPGDSSSRAGGGAHRGGTARRRTDLPPRASSSRQGAPREPRVEGPAIPDHITGRELDRGVASQLRGLPERVANQVARHLVAAGELLDSDPEAAYRHAVAARTRAARLAVVREAAGETAYAAGHYAEALSELRAARRINGAIDYLPMIADCLRGLGQPREALRIARNAAEAKLSSALRAELTIVEAGARQDLGQHDAAVRLLESAPLHASTRDPWLARLRYAYAEALLSAGRATEALAWFHRAEAVDNDQVTDAAARASDLEAALE